MDNFQPAYWSVFQRGFFFISLALTLLLLLTINSKKQFEPRNALIIWLVSLLLHLAQAQMTVFAGILQDEFNLTSLKPIIVLAGYSLLVVISQTIVFIVTHQKQKRNQAIDDKP